MADKTPRLDLERFDQGDATWDHTDTVEALDENAIVHGPIADRPTTGTYDDELYHATDQNITWRWDGTSSDWVHFSGLGSESQRVPGTSHLTDIDVNTLADTALSGQIDTTQLSDDAVTAAKIAAAAVQSEQIATDAVGSAEIATDAVSVDELAEALGTTSSNRVPGTTHFEESSHEALEAGSVNTDALGITEFLTEDLPLAETVPIFELPIVDGFFGTSAQITKNVGTNDTGIWDADEAGFAGTSNGVCHIYGTESGNTRPNYHDMIIWNRNEDPVVVPDATNSSQSPADRSYGRDSSELTLAMSEDTYATLVIARHGRVLNV